VFVKSNIFGEQANLVPRKSCRYEKCQQAVCRVVRLSAVSCERMFKVLSTIVLHISSAFLVNLEVSFNQVKDIRPVGKSAGKCKQMLRSISNVISCEFESLDIFTDTRCDLNRFTSVFKRLLPPSDRYHCEVCCTVVGTAVSLVGVTLGPGG
jgi:hypothetical protein